jgi:hypothetical protein
VPLTTRPPLHAFLKIELEPVEGFEPPTRSLQNCRSTPELHRPECWRMFTVPKRVGRYYQTAPLKGKLQREERFRTALCPVIAEEFY